MIKQIIIGITGLTGSGKDTVAEYLKAKGFFYSSLSDRIREECAVRSLPTDRDNLIAVGNDLREEFGHDVLAKKSLEKFIKEGIEKVILVSIRHPKEVEYLKSQSGFSLVAVETPIELRYKRNSQRGRPEDTVSFEKFKEQEEKERFGSEAQQQIDKVIAMADFRLENNGTIEELNKQVEEILGKIMVTSN